MAFVIRGLGTAVPATRIRQEESERLAWALGQPSAEQATWLPVMYAHTGIRTRHTQFPAEVVQDVVNGTKRTGSVFLPRGTPEDEGPTTGQRMEHYRAAAGPLVAQAAQRALEQAQLPRTRLTHLVTVSCTGFHAPGVDVELIRQLELPPAIERTHVGYMGCHGSLNGLRVARAVTTAYPESCVLLCAVELCSLHYHYGWDPQKMIANALFADGAGAVVGTADGAADSWRVAASGSCLLPDSADAMTWTIGDHGFAMTLSRQVPELIRTHLRPWLNRWLDQHQHTLADIASWAVHPGGPKILEAVEEALSLPREALTVSREVLAEYGNMSSPTILFILENLRRRDAPRPCVALGFGPGLTVEAALLV
jgi:predicted naringenin-chalcone synthase